MKSAVICGSSRFATEMREFAQKLKDLKVVVYEPHLYRALGGVWEEIKDFDKKFVAMGLTHDHFYKIRMADVVYIFNKDGYIGISTNIEIGYAVALNKPVYVYEELDEDPCRKILFRKAIKTPEELVEVLK
jgi:hypothetical protein